MPGPQPPLPPAAPADYAALTNLDRSGPSNDIALLTLAHPAAGAPTAALPDPAAAAAVPSPGQRVWAAGWGLTEDGTASAALRYTDLRVLGEGEGGGKAFADNFVAGGTAGYTCQVLLHSDWLLAWWGRLMCAALLPHALGASWCMPHLITPIPICLRMRALAQGDSGGPVVQPGATTGGADTLVGITSWGDQDCCVPFSFYVRVADHARWLAARLAAAAASGDGSGGGEGDCGLPASTQEWVTRVLQLR